MPVTELDNTYSEEIGTALCYLDEIIPVDPSVNFVTFLTLQSGEAKKDIEKITFQLINFDKKTLPSPPKDSVSIYVFILGIIAGLRLGINQQVNEEKRVEVAKGIREYFENLRRENR